MSKICSIGSVPNDFIDLKLKDLADTTVMNSFTDGDWIESKHMSYSGVRLIQTGNIGVGKFIEKDNKKYISEETFNELKCKEVKEGDILICRLADPIGRSCIIPKINSKLITSVDVALLRINKKYFDNKYINYYFNFEKHLNTINSFASGTTRQRISRGNLGEVKVAVPPLKEQQKIAAILSSVDAAIEKTEQVIAKTEEVKKGLMQQLLTKGIDHTEFKESDIGQIPSDWNLLKLGDIATISGGKRLPKGEMLVSENTGHPYIRVTDMTEDKIILDKILYVPSNLVSKLKRYTVEEGDLYIAVAGHTLGKVGMIPRELHGANLTENADRISSIKCNEKYLEYVLRSDIIQLEINQVKTSNAQPKLALQKIKDFLIPLPDLEEQNKISEILFSFDKRLEINNTELLLLSKVKQGLMQQLLTGQVRVKID